MLWQYMSFRSQMWYYSFPVSSIHFSFYCPFQFQMMQKWLLSCQMPHCLSNITRKVISKGGLPAFILSAFFFRIRIFKACILQYQLCAYCAYFLLLWEKMFSIYKTCPVSVSQMMNTAHWLVCVPSLFCPLIDVLQHSCFKWRVHRTAAFVEGKESAEQT